MQAAFMERSSTVVREKRGLASSSVDDGPDKKRPALSSVIVEALKVDSLQKLCSSLEPVLRKVVSEEVERALSKLSPTKLTGSGRSSPKYLEAAVGRNLLLCFRSKLSLPLFTGGKVEGEQGGAIHIVLMDADTGQVVTAGPESLVKLDVVVLEGDFNNEDDSTWTQEEFDSHVVKEREGKRPLLAGDLQVLLKDGVGTLGELMFTDNSSWIRSRKFRLGLKVASDHCEGIRIREAKTEAFTVKDHRGELYKKHYPPALHDEVWRLEKIGKDGSFHRRLNRAGIYTVEDFLRLVVRDSQRLRNILGSGMSNKMWEILVEHARTCVLSGKLFVYFPDDVRSVAVVFNNIYELTGLIANGEYYAVDSLSENQKVYVDGLVTKAYDNWMHVVEYDDKSLFGGKEDESVEAAQTHTQTDPQAYPDMVHQQQTLPTLSVQCPLDQPSVDSCLNMGGYINTLAASLPVQSHSGNFSSPSQFCGQSFPLQDQLGTTSQLVQPPGHNHQLADGQPHSFSMLGCHGFGSSAEEGCFPEEKIDMRSIENEDMQHLLHFINMGGHGHTPASVTEDGYPHSSGNMLNPSPNYGLESEGSCSSAKAVAGWLKLKAALKWGIFIQQRAAERRAQLVELEDT